MLMHDAGGGGGDEVDRWVFGAGGCSAAVFAQYLGVNMSSLSMTAFTVERYVAICHPFTARVADSAGRARRVTLTLWIVGIASVSRSLFPVVAAAFFRQPHTKGGSVAEWLACWTQAQMARVQIAVATLSGKSLKQPGHTHRASVHQAAKLVAALLRVAGVTAGLAESNGSLPPGL